MNERRRIFASPNSYLAETSRLVLLKIDPKVISLFRKRNDNKMTMDVVDSPKNSGMYTLAFSLSQKHIS